VTFLYPRKRSVIVNLKTGKSFRGILWATRVRFIVLRKAEFLKTRSEAVPVDHELVFYRENIEFIQVLA